MDSSDTPRRATRSRTKMAVVLGAAALALPGGALIGNAVASDGQPGSSSAVEQQAPGAGFAPVQETQPDRERDGRPPCPEKDGDRSGNGASGTESPAPQAQPAPEQTAL